MSLSDNQNIFVFVLYLPSDNAIHDYKDSIQCLDDFFKYYSQFGPVIFAGDFNAQFDTKPASAIAQKKIELFKDFLQVNSLVPVNKTDLCTSQTYTFPTLRTMIDYILKPETFRDCISNCEVVSTADTDIASDHFACSLCQSWLQYK